jgi:Fe-S cluster assembly iron-binding protein IscA
MYFFTFTPLFLKYGGAMLGITAKAKKKHKEILQNHSMDPEVAIRIIPNGSDSKRLDLILDKEKRGDQLVISDEGMKLLLIRLDLSQWLEGITLDYNETARDGVFTIKKITRH